LAANTSRTLSSLSGLNLRATAIILWNTRYLERAVAALRQTEDVPDQLLAHLSPLGWEHVNLTGDYIWMNPNDNQGIRYVLAGCLLRQDNDSALKELLAAHEDGSAFWLSLSTSSKALRRSVRLAWPPSGL
jgi:hypothetical protein